MTKLRLLCEHFSRNYSKILEYTDSHERTQMYKAPDLKAMHSMLNPKIASYLMFFYNPETYFGIEPFAIYECFVNKEEQRVLRWSPLTKHEIDILHDFLNS